MNSVKESLRDQWFAIVLVLQGFLGGIQILDAFSVTYYPMIHRVSTTEQFDLGFSLVLPLIFFLVLWGYWMRRQGSKFVVYPVLGFVLYPWFNLEAGVSGMSLIALVVGLYVSRSYELVVKWSLILVSVFEGCALLHWVFFVPFGLASPFTALSFLELRLFYVFSYIAPLLVLPLMFMWLLKLLVGWGWSIDFDEKPVYFGEEKIEKVNYYLILILLLSILVSIYPFLPSVNPEGITNGVDYQIYVRPVSYTHLTLPTN